MFNRYLVAGLFVALLAFAASGVSAAYADDASHWAAAEDLLVVSETGKMYEHGFNLGLQTQVKSMPQEFRDVVQAFYAKYLSWDIVKGDVTKLYVESFTEEELKDITAFYRTPTGKKAITLLPSMLAKGVELSQHRVEEHKDELLASLAAVKKKLDAEKQAPKAEPKEEPKKPL